MATLTIRNVPDDVKRTLRMKAAETGRSLEDSLRRLLAEQANEGDHRASNIDAGEIMRRAAELESDKPVDNRYQYLSQKELSDAISGEYDGL